MLRAETESRKLPVLLLLAAVGACAGTGPHCARLADSYRHEYPTESRVSVQGVECQVVLQWRSEVARATAALLRAALHHALRYPHVNLAEGSENSCSSEREYRSCKLVVMPAAQWEECSLPAERRVLGASATPARPHLHAHLAPTARLHPDCVRAASAAFYADAVAIQRCGFRRRDASGAAIVYVPRGSLRNTTAADVAELVEGAAATSLLLRLEHCDRTELLGMLQNDSHSFLFLDFEMYSDMPHTMPVEHPRCACACQRESVAQRVVDINLMVYAPLFADVMLQLAPRPPELRKVLELMARSGNEDIEEAACDWATGHASRFHSWIPKKRYDYWVAVMRCVDDPDQPDHKVILEIMVDELWNITRPKFGINLKFFDINCTDPSANMNQLTHSSHQYRCVGVVAGAEGALLVEDAKNAGLPVVIYDTPAEAPSGVRLATGSAIDLARALQFFLNMHSWRRVGVISERTKLADALESALRTGSVELMFRVERLPQNVTHGAAEEALLKLKAAKARVVLINADAKTAGTLVAVAARLGMTGDEYVWLSREWRGDGSPLRLFTVSFGCRAEAEANGGSDMVRKRLAQRLGSRVDGSLWGPRASALVDAVMTLGMGLEALIRLHPGTRDDLHGKETVRLLWESFDKSNVSGLCQELRYEGDLRAHLLVVVAEWRGGKRRAVAEWRANKAAPAVLWLHRFFNDTPTDGTESCMFPAGDEFTPNCQDTQWIIVGLLILLALAFAPFAGMRVKRAVSRRVARYRIKVAAQVISRRQTATQAIVGHLVERSAVEVRRELGAGRFGHVRLAVLRAPNRAPRAVAAKALRDGAAPSEEGDFLREACTLAALDHEHVVRLVGVCVTDGPPLVLMEYAFFGDLLQYLRARRHLAEGAEDVEDAERAVGTEETAHVSAEALTRLVREAASALGYLAYRGIVHRDVRAANCLVDARRKLKLGDFGMARETHGSSSDGVAEYACRRRGLFPVLWMAPESLDRGAFSAASDVWALGVLALEVVTLGARPFGKRSPLRVLQYVVNGGRPPLPLDATVQTRGVAMACWRRRPSERPSAADVVAYLAARPTALCPALAVDCDGADADSGFGEPDAQFPSDATFPPDVSFPLTGTMGTFSL